MRTFLIYIASLLAFAGVAQAQTRATACSPTTPNNAACVEADPVTTYSDGTAIQTGTAVTYKLERRLGTTGAWAQVGAAQASPQFYVTSLAIGTHYFRMYATVGAVDSSASNIASRDSTSSTPSAPVIRVTKVTISSDRAPVYEVLPDEVEFDYDRGRRVGNVRVGNVCDASRTTGDGYYALERPSAATLNRARSAGALPNALVAKCGPNA